MFPKIWFVKVPTIFKLTHLHFKILNNLEEIQNFKLLTILEFIIFHNVIECMRTSTFLIFKFSFICFIRYLKTRSTYIHWEMIKSFILCLSSYSLLSSLFSVCTHVNYLHGVYQNINAPVCTPHLHLYAYNVSRKTWIPFNIRNMRSIMLS
jgi:hypothetical protein